jgi:hypothetical protein
MKNNINAALQAKKDKSLNIRVRYEEGIMTRREWLKMQLVKGATVEESTKNRIQFDRVKFNRMKGGIWSNEQEEYEKKCNERVKCWELRLPGDSSFWEITKTEYEHFKALQLEEDINTQKAELSEKIEAGTATDAEIEEDMQREYDYAAKYF